MTTIIINGEEVPAALIGDLAPIADPARDMKLAAMLGSETPHVTIAQILSMLNSGDLDGKIWQGFIHAATEKAIPADADELALADSGDGWRLKKLTWAKIKAALASIFLPSNGGAITQSLGIGQGLGIGGRWPASGGVLYIHRAAGNPSILLSSGDPGAPTEHGQIRADTAANRIGFTNPTGAVWGLYYNPVTDKASVSSNPTSSLGIATKQYVDAAVAAGGGLGVGQTWQDVTANRAINTVYQNTSGKPIQLRVFVPNSGGTILKVSANNSTWVQLGRANTANDQYPIIPPDYYYMGDGGTFNGWAELR